MLRVSFAGCLMGITALAGSSSSTFNSWVDNGAPEGDPKDKPVPLTFHEGWNINPDMVIEMPNDFKVPARGAIDYQYFLVKAISPRTYGFAKGKCAPAIPRWSTT